MQHSANGRPALYIVLFGRDIFSAATSHSSSVLLNDEQYSIQKKLICFVCLFYFHFLQMAPHNSQLDKEKASLNEVKTYFVFFRSFQVKGDGGVFRAKSKNSVKRRLAAPFLASRGRFFFQKVLDCGGYPYGLAVPPPLSRTTALLLVFQASQPRSPCACLPEFHVTTFDFFSIELIDSILQFNTSALALLNRRIESEATLAYA
ncbi:hypothetical protein T10_1234 [Trichinella papuae]|uniref:Uncharacterized protein n=1 Tax=Trichinella papuae TaxID=268474 RepID=A0A0V1MX90_9BILA|nr:hypothetical protein T10_1234 [Trichinella papuae]